ncbi:hypothetical protein ACWEEK_27170 [Micromonospora aurantiaca (nom. illeg.)]
MATNWVEVAKVLAPVGASIVAVAGVWIGGSITRRSTAQSFTREFVFKEMDRRRQLAVDYKKSVWAFGSRVETLRKLVHELVEKQKAAQEVEAAFDFPGTREKSETLRNAFADLEAFSSTNLQYPARATMEALTKCYNACVNKDVLEADAQWATYQAQWELTGDELNKESEHFNAIIYASFTPLWRAILRRSLRKPLPYVALGHPTEVKHAGERLRLKRPDNGPNIIAKS